MPAIPIEKFQNSQRDLVMAVGRAFVDTDKKELPEFFVIVLADIKNGIMAKMTFAFKDLSRMMQDPFFQEEFMQRLIVDYPQGNAKIIGDKTGANLDIVDLTWTDFLAKQIVYRMNYRYTRSAFPPSSDPKQEILNAVADSFRSYEFKDYGGLILHDLAVKTTAQIPKSNLDDLIAAQPSDSGGKLIHIKFGY